ncbi:VCBS repeat-containing protein [Spongiivirga sp. MCCC 1A20706]|uniref:FG-GAP repeat domain-containing protein n=1 Tax=Spongiivirga sp. MCCC 1A20706 TaxID=3160963 RepID=UPI0039776BFF
MNKTIGLLFIAMLFLACQQSNQIKKQEALYKLHCASCHVAPSIQSLPKNIWAEAILPDMGARMGIKDSSYNPMKGLSFRDQEAVLKTGIYPLKPIIGAEDWALLKSYIIDNAPDSLVSTAPEVDTSTLTSFETIPISLDKNPGTFITYLEYDKEKNTLKNGTIMGGLFEYDFASKKNERLGNFETGVVDYDEKDSIAYVTEVGKLDPSEIASGAIVKKKGPSETRLKNTLHRPVHNTVYDFDGNGKDELVVCEFGNLVGELSILIENEQGAYDKKTLLAQPGAIRTLVEDMDNNGLADIIAITSQGDESMTILYQEKPLEFRAEKVIRFSPIYGSSWFELVDYNKDGFKDIITVNGDNADKSYVHKPYHGMRIHINDGNNNFEETYFYSLNGATRLLARDFDQDGDIDFALISTFPDYDKKPELSFVYLENEEASNYQFKSYTIKEHALGRWFLMDAGDVDRDGDLDIVLSSFSYVFTPVPDTLSKGWNEGSIDAIILENKLK